jgi:DNA helicase IV
VTSAAGGPGTPGDDAVAGDGLTEPRPGAKRDAIAAEQAHVDRTHDRVEELRQRADQRAFEAAADRSGSTFQARFERDVTAHHHAARAARFTFGDVESLAFGRLDLDDARRCTWAGSRSSTRRGNVLLVDWRAPRRPRSTAPPRPNRSGSPDVARW